MDPKVFLSASLHSGKHFPIRTVAKNEPKLSLVVRLKVQKRQSI